MSRSVQLEPPYSPDSPDSAIELLYRRHAPAARRLAYFLTGDADLAEDVVQEAFTRIIAARPAIDSPRAYLAAVISSIVTSRHRSAARERARLQRVVPVAEAVEWGLGEPEVWNALQGLPYRQRAAIILCLGCDMSDVEAARALGCRPGTVRSLMSRGLQELRRQVADGVD